MPAKKTDRKIFKKSDKSRIRSDLEFDPCYWSLRSVDSYYRYIIGYVHDSGFIHNNYASNNYGVLPVCTI